jgi:hypothetical protein
MALFDLGHHLLLTLVPLRTRQTVAIRHPQAIFYLRARNAPAPDIAMGAGLETYAAKLTIEADTLMICVV